MATAADLRSSSRSVGEPSAASMRAYSLSMSFAMLTSSGRGGPSAGRGLARRLQLDEQAVSLGGHGLERTLGLRGARMGRGHLVPHGALLLAHLLLLPGELLLELGDALGQGGHVLLGGLVPADPGRPRLVELLAGSDVGRAPDPL